MVKAMYNDQIVYIYGSHLSVFWNKFMKKEGSFNSVNVN